MKLKKTISVDIDVQLENLQFFCYWLDDNLDKWEISTMIPRNYTGKLYLTNISNVDWTKNSFKVRGFNSRQLCQDDLTSVTAYLDTDIDAMAVKLAWS